MKRPYCPDHAGRPLHAVALRRCLLPLWPALPLLPWLVPGAALAQSPGELQRLLTPPPSLSTPPRPQTPVTEAAPDQALQTIARLNRVVVHSEVLADVLQAYWSPYLQQPVPAEALANYWQWAVALLRAEGYLADLDFEVLTEADGQGQRLQVAVQVPRLRRLSVVSASAEQRQSHGALVRQRLLAHLPAGQVLNTLALDQRLEVASHDLPVELEALLRPAGQGEVDVEIHVSSKGTRSGANGWLQASNYGLDTYGRAQLSGQLQTAGLWAHAQAGLTFSGADGVQYLAGEHEALAPWLRGRWHVRASEVRSTVREASLTASAGRARELALGTTHLLGHWGDRLLQSRLEWVHRESESQLRQSGLVISQTQDRHWRLGLELDNERTRSDATRVQGQLLLGSRTHRLQSQAPTEAFRVVQLQAQTRQTLGRTGRWQWRGQARAQWSTDALESYHQFSLGGPYGVRAFQSDQATGDRGVLGSMELRYVIAQGQQLGVFADAGRSTLQARTAGGVAQSYRLQALGLSWQVQLGASSLQLSLARGQNRSSTVAGEGSSAGAAVSPSASRAYIALQHRFH